MILSEGVKITKKDFDNILTDRDIRVGFEFEFSVNRHPYENDDFADDDEWLEGMIATDLKGSMEDAIGVDITISSSIDYDDKMAKDFEKGWYLETDGSISIPNHGFELTSPALNVNDIFKKIDDVFAWLDNHKLGGYEIYTTNETGFHVTVSYKSPEFVKQNFNALKLAILLNDHHVLEQFERTDYYYSQSHLKALKTALKNNYGDAYLTIHDDINKISKELGNLIEEDKYRSFNYGKLKRNGILEYRIIGNKDYHTRGVEIKKNIIKFAQLLKIACDKDAYQQEFIKGLQRFLNKSIPSQSVDDDSKFGPLYAKFRKSINRQPKYLRVVRHMLYSAETDKNFTEALKTLILYIGRDDHNKELAESFIRHYELDDSDLRSLYQQGYEYTPRKSQYGVISRIPEHYLDLLVSDRETRKNYHQTKVLFDILTSEIEDEGLQRLVYDAYVGTRDSSKLGNKHDLERLAILIMRNATVKDKVLSVLKSLGKELEYIVIHPKSVMTLVFPKGVVRYSNRVSNLSDFAFYSEWFKHDLGELLLKNEMSLFGYLRMDDYSELQMEVLHKYAQYLVMHDDIVSDQMKTFAKMSSGYNNQKVVLSVLTPYGFTELWRKVNNGIYYASVKLTVNAITILANFLVDQPPATLKKIEQIAKKIGTYNTIMKMPLVLDHLITYPDYVRDILLNGRKISMNFIEAIRSLEPVLVKSYLSGSVNEILKDLSSARKNDVIRLLVFMTTTLYDGYKQKQIMGQDFSDAIHYLAQTYDLSLMDVIKRLPQSSETEPMVQVLMRHHRLR